MFILSERIIFILIIIIQYTMECFSLSESIT